MSVSNVPSYSPSSQVAEKRVISRLICLHQLELAIPVIGSYPEEIQNTEYFVYN